MRPLLSLAKRDLLAASKYDPEKVRAYADQFFSEERYGDALEFYRKLGDREGMLKVKKASMDLGDPELLWRIEHADGTLVGREDWVQCGDRAMALGKHRSAAYIFQRIGDEDRLAAAEKEFKPPSEASKAPE